MAGDSEYLGNNLNKRAYDVVPVINLAVETVMRQANAAGRLGSGNTIHEIMTQSLRVLTEEVQKGLQFAYNFRGTNEDVDAVRYVAGRVEAIIMDKVVEGSMRLGLAEWMVAPHVAKLRVELSERKDRLIDDFAHGMMGENRMKKDPVINVVQNNSPGAVQQVGSNFNQSAFNQNHHSLVQVIDKALASPEFAALKSEDQVEVRDLADVVKLEAEKAEPDAGKLKRWGDKLVKVSGEVGLKVVSSTIAALLLKMYTG